MGLHMDPLSNLPGKNSTAIEQEEVSEYEDRALHESGGLGLQLLLIGQIARESKLLLATSHADDWSHSIATMRGCSDSRIMDSQLCCSIAGIRQFSSRPTGGKNSAMRKLLCGLQAVSSDW